MSFDVQIAHSVDEVGQEAWDRLSRERPFTSYRWYRFGEKAVAYSRPFYVILSRQGEPMARATFWLASREYLPIPSKLLCYLLEATLRRWPLLICQSPLSSTAATSGLILPDPPLRDAALKAIAEVAEELMRENRASLCTFSYLEEHETRWSGWPGHFLRGRTPGPGTCLTITWPDMKGYLAHLGKKQRYNLRRNIRLASDLGIEIRHYPAVQDIGTAMALHRNVNRRHKAQTEPWMSGAMEHADMVDAVWLAAEIEGRMVGCELMLGDRDAWLVTGLGLDYGVEYTYFVLGYADIQYAIEHGARVLRWGSLTYHVKKRLGFEAENNNHDVFVGRGLFHKLGSWMAETWG
jgi:predicted N-acyltransferase